jgi:hypothetical protein
VKRAALLVHGMEVADREWLLGQLAPRDRGRMQGMLAELQTLGIPASRELLEGVVAAAGPRDVVSVADAGATVETPHVVADEDQVLTTGRCSGAALARVLAHEPPELIAHLLDAQRWPWHGDLLARLDPAARADVEKALLRLRRAGHAPAHALRRAALAGLAARLPVNDSAVENVDPAPSRRARLSRWWSTRRRRA